MFFLQVPWYILMSLWEAKAFTEISGMTQAQLQLEVAIAGVLYKIYYKRKKT